MTKPSFDADLRVSILVPRDTTENADLPNYLCIQLESPNAPFNLDFRTADVNFVSELIRDLTMIRDKLAASPNNAAFTETEELVRDPEIEVKLNQFGLVPVPSTEGNNPTKEN